MGNEENLIEKRKEKMIKWLKEPYNFALLSVIIFVIALRLYYFSLTLNQAIWWDGAEYMNMARAIAFKTHYLFQSYRPIFLSWVIALFYKLALPAELFTKIFIFILSFASLIGVYLLGKEIGGKYVGLISFYLMSVFYLHVFFSYRILLDIPAFAFFVLSAYFFYKYFKYNSKKSLYLAMALIGIGTMFKQSAPFLLVAMFIYLLFTEKFKFLKRKEIWIGLLIFWLVISPYILWGYFVFNSFIFTETASTLSQFDYGIMHALISFKDKVINYFSLFPTYLSWPLLILFLLSLISAYKIIIGFDFLLKGKADRNLKRDLFLVLIFIIPILLISYTIGHNEDRYIINSFPAIFILSSLSIMKIYNFINKKYPNHKIFAILLILLFLGYVGYVQIVSADNLTKSRVASYAEIKQAGLWLKQNTLPSEIIATQSIHHIVYYADREIQLFPETAEEFDELLKKNQEINYFMVSIVQNSPPWTYTYPQENNFTPVEAYFADIQQTQPLLVIYRID